MACMKIRAERYWIPFDLLHLLDYITIKAILPIHMCASACCEWLILFIYSLIHTTNDQQLCSLSMPFIIRCSVKERKLNIIMADAWWWKTSFLGFPLISSDSHRLVLECSFPVQVVYHEMKNYMLNICYYLLQYNNPLWRILQCS